MTDEHYEHLLRFYRAHRGMDVTSREFRELCRASGIDADEVYDCLMSLELDCDFMP